MNAEVLDGFRYTSRKTLRALQTHWTAHAMLESHSFQLHRIKAMTLSRCCRFKKNAHLAKNRNITNSLCRHFTGFLSSPSIFLPLFHSIVDATKQGNALTPLYWFNRWKKKFSICLFSFSLLFLSKETLFHEFKIIKIIRLQNYKIIN